MNMHAKCIEKFWRVQENIDSSMLEKAFNLLDISFRFRGR